MGTRRWSALAAALAALGTILVLLALTVHTNAPTRTEMLVVRVRQTILAEEAAGKDAAAEDAGEDEDGAEDGAEDTVGTNYTNFHAENLSPFEDAEAIEKVLGSLVEQKDPIYDVSFPAAYHLHDSASHAAVVASRAPTTLRDGLHSSDRSAC